MAATAFPRVYHHAERDKPREHKPFNAALFLTFTPHPSFWLLWVAWLSYHSACSAIQQFGGVIPFPRLLLCRSISNALDCFGDYIVKGSAKQAPSLEAQFALHCLISLCLHAQRQSEEMHRDYCHCEAVYALIQYFFKINVCLFAIPMVEIHRGVGRTTFK